MELTFAQLDGLANYLRGQAEGKHIEWITFEEADYGDEALVTVVYNGGNERDDIDLSPHGVVCLIYD